MRICPKCHTKLPEQANFCFTCGFALDRPPVAPPKQPETTAQRETEPVKPKAGSVKVACAEKQEFEKQVKQLPGAEPSGPAKPSKSEGQLAEEGDDSPEREFGPTTKTRKRAAIVTAVAVVTVFALILSSIILSLLDRKKEKKPYVVTKLGRQLQVTNVVTGKNLKLEDYVAQTAAPEWFYQESADRPGLVYGVGEDTDNYRLSEARYSRLFSGEGRPEVIDEHAAGRFFATADGSVFYRTTAGLLFRYKDGNREQLAEQVVDFLLSANREYVAYQTEDGGFSVRPVATSREQATPALKTGGEDLLWVANSGDLFYTGDKNQIWCHRKGEEPVLLVDKYTQLRPVTEKGTFYFTVDKEETIPLLETVTDRYKDEDAKLTPPPLSEEGSSATDAEKSGGALTASASKKYALPESKTRLEEAAKTAGEDVQGSGEQALKKQIRQADRYLQKLERDRRRRTLAGQNVRLKRSELWFFDGGKSRLIDSSLGKIVAASSDARSIIYDVVGNLGSGQSDLSELDDIASYRDRLQKDNERGYKLAADGVTSTLLPAGPLESPFFDKENREITYIYGEDRLLMNTYLENKVVFDTLTLAEDVSSAEEKTVDGRQLYYKLNAAGKQDLYENGEKLLENVSWSMATKTDILALIHKDGARQLVRRNPGGQIFTLSKAVQDASMTSGYAIAFVQEAKDQYELCYSPSGGKVKSLAKFDEPAEIIEPLLLDQEKEGGLRLPFSED